MKLKSILVTGAAGFIGFHMSELLLNKGYKVVGYDSMSNYYDIKIKLKRLKILKQYKNFYFHKNKLENKSYLKKIFKKYKFKYVIHLAAQAGVRHSIDHPEEYISTNIIGTYNIFECCKSQSIKHLLVASTSSVYGASKNMPYKELENTNTPMSVYAATKISTESIGHAYAYNWGIPMTFFRFFTVYGTWGRPDMALFKFTESIIKNKKFDLYNSGKMYRDFTYVNDLVKSIFLLIEKIPKKNNRGRKNSLDSISPVAPYRVINIGNSEKIYLRDFIKFLENKIGKKAKFRNLGMQKGDVVATHANTKLLQVLTKFKPKTSIKSGISNFVNWYKEYHKIN